MFPAGAVLGDPIEWNDPRDVQDLARRAGSYEPEETFTALRAKFVSDLEVSRAALTTAAKASPQRSRMAMRTTPAALNAFLANAHRSPSEGTAAPLRHEILNSDERSKLDSASPREAPPALPSRTWSTRWASSSSRSIRSTSADKREKSRVCAPTRAVERKPAPVDYDSIACHASRIVKTIRSECGRILRSQQWRRALNASVLSTGLVARQPRD